MKNRFVAVVAPLILSANVSAGVIEVTNVNNLTSNGNCNVSSVQITSITTNPGNTGVTGLTYPIDSTKCLGYVTTPHNDWGNNPVSNQGQLGDGLLNQEPNKDGYFVGGSYFLDHPDDSLVDIDNDGDATDPGWIRLWGTEEGYDSIGNYDLEDVLDISFNQDGSWSVSVDPLAIPFATQALGRPSVFDHLAFVLKGPNPNSGHETSGWAIYDFNFNELIANGLNISLGDTAYNFAGTWDYASVSHASIWAHDPPASTTTVTEPSTIMIMALGLLWMYSRRIRQL